jgi:purine-binding chemotaxis protein CheW
MRRENGIKSESRGENMAKAIIPKSRAGKTQAVAFKGYGDGSVDFLGDQIEAITGYQRAEFNEKRKKWLDVILNEDKPGMKLSFVQALKSDKTYNREYRVTAKNGNILWLQEWSQIICDAVGEIEYITGILLNITEQKQTEIALMKAEERTGKYLTFSLAGQEYGLSILKVKEIIEVLPITPVPQAPPFVKGVINLRGKVIPIVDLRLKLGMEKAEQTERSCIIVTEIGTSQNAKVHTGVIVDGVSEVVYITGNDIDDAPSVITGLDSGFILGMAKFGNTVKIILDIDRVLDGLQLPGV